MIMATQYEPIDEYLEVLRAYEADAGRAGTAFVEIQHTMLFATVGQRHD